MPKFKRGDIIVLDTSIPYPENLWGAAVSSRGGDKSFDFANLPLNTKYEVMSSGGNVLPLDKSLVPFDYNRDGLHGNSVVFQHFKLAPKLPLKV